MTCQNCGHPQERHPAIWYGSQRGRPLTSCDDCPCTAYREPEPAPKMTLEDFHAHMREHEMDYLKTDPVPAVTDLPDAETAYRAWQDGLYALDPKDARTAFLAGFAAAHGDVSVNKGQSDTIPDAVVEAAAEASHIAYEDAALEHGWETQKRSRVPWADVPAENKATVRVAIRAALAAASGPWAEHLDAAERSNPKHGVALNNGPRGGILCLCGEVCNPKMGRSPAHIMGSKSDTYVAVNAGTVFAQHLREANADRDALAAALARNAELEREVAAFRKSNEDWRATTGEAIAEQEAAQRESRSWESNYNALKAENAQLRSRVTEGLVCPTCKHDFADDARAELDNLRDRVTALADECDVKQMGEKVERENAHRAKKGSTDEFFHYGKQRAWGEARNLIRAALVRGSDDAGEDA